MRPTLSDIHRRIEAIAASSQTPFIVFVKAVFEGDDITDLTIYASVDEALEAFKRAHRITSDMDNKSLIFIDTVPRGIEEYNRDTTPHEDIDYTGPDISEDEERARAAIIGYTIQD